MSVRSAPVVLFLVLVVGLTVVILGGRAMLSRHEPWVPDRPKMGYETAVANLSDVKPETLTAKRKFVFSLANEMVKQNPGQNNCFSPAGIEEAVSILLNGAQGDTFDVCAKVIGLTDPNVERLNIANSKIDDVLGSLEGGPVLIANSIWSVLPMKFNKSYTDDMARYYDADVRKLGSAGQNALSMVNDWVKDKTKGRVPMVFKKISRDARALIVNVVTFDGSWMKPFDPATPGTFHAPKGDVKTSMMSRPGVTALVYEDADLRAASVPYEQKGLSMWIVMSRKGGLPTLDDRRWDKIAKTTESQTLTVTMPKFRFATDYDMKPVITALGGGPLFLAGNDFTFMTHDGGKDFYVSQFVHKAYIDVDEKGTKAAAATGVEVGEASMPVSTDFIVDRPFVFLITESATGAVLFYGSVVDPTQT